MSGSTDDIKGRIKEAAGDLTNDDDLKREGKADQAGAKVWRSNEVKTHWVPLEMR